MDIVSTNITEQATNAKLALQWSFNMKRTRRIVDMEEGKITTNNTNGSSDGTPAESLLSTWVQNHPSDTAAATATATENEIQRYTISLSDTKYERDDAPLVTGCQCHACVHHTRQYIHHLVKAKELLGNMHA